MVTIQSDRQGKYAALVGSTLMLTIVYMSLTSWSVAVNELALTFNLSGIQIQAGASMLIAGYAIGSFVEGKWVAKYGWKRTFNMVIYPFIIASALIPLMTNYYAILFLRFIQGWGCMVSITCAIISTWFPTKERGLAIGVLLGAIGLGSAFGGYLGGVLNPMIGWKNTFWVISGITIVGVIIFYALVKEAPPLEEEVVAQNTDGAPAKQVNLFKEPALWILGIATLCCFFNAYGMYAFLAQYLFSLDYSASDVGTIVFLNGFIALICTPVVGLISDKLVSRMGAQKARCWACAWLALFVAVVGCVLVPHLSPLGYGPAVIAALLAGWGVPATNGAGLTIPADIFGSAAAGPGIGIVILIAGAGGIIAPIFVPWIASVTSWYVGWYVTAGAALLALVMYLILSNIKMRAK